MGQRFRFAHSVRVARCADILAQRHGADPRKARLAGLLHDLARLYSPERLVAECEARGLPIDAAERLHPMLLHAKLGAAIARERFGVHDAQVLSAIEKHTTAAGEMSPLDCIVYLADSLEPHRSFPERADLWSLALDDLAAAMRGVLLLTMRHNARKGVATVPATLSAAANFGLTAADGVPPEVRASAS
ncbi:MAG: bis(5'-nucleosyl)-tetraphosphatase (symmetrical) YqeK [Candidatus Cybelea sp.]